MSRSPETAGGDAILHAVVDAQTSEARVRTCFWESPRRHQVSDRPYSVFFYKNTASPLPPPVRKHTRKVVVSEIVELEADPELPGYREPVYGRQYRCIYQPHGNYRPPRVNIGVPETFGPPDFRAVHEYILEQFEQETTLGEPQSKYPTDFKEGITLPSYAIMYEPHSNASLRHIEQHIVCAVAGHLALDKYL